MGILVGGVDRDDVGVLQLRQGLWLGPLDGRDFQHHRTSGEVALPFSAEAMPRGVWRGGEDPVVEVS